MSVVDSIDSQADDAGTIALCCLLVGLGLVIVAVANRLARWSEEAPKAHLRAAQLQAYRRRHQWRKADVSKLRALGVCQNAEKRLQRIERGKQRGRGVVQQYRPLDVLLNEAIDDLRFLFATDTPPAARKAKLKGTLWWPHIVECLYRGEYASCKAQGWKAPSDEAERKVSEHLGISAAVVRKLCTSVRQQGGDRLVFPAASVAEFIEWQRTGRFLRPDKPGPVQDGDGQAWFAATSGLAL